VNFIESHWYRPTILSSLLLAPLEALYAGVTAVRRHAYRAGWLRRERLPVPVVVVGNVNVGGVGKTPLTSELIACFAERGLHVGVISRGYGGSHREATEVFPDSDPSQVGDEPILLATAGARVAVGRDRVAAGRLLLAAHPEIDLILADDGLQHYRLQRDLEVVVIDGARGFGNGHLLPGGPLREPLRRLADADVLVINGEARSDLALPAGIPRFAMTLEPGPAWRLSDPSTTRTPDAFAPERVIAMAGIGHPERFFSTLRGLGIRPARELIFPDHHAYGAEDIPTDADSILITSKDAAKMRRFNHAKLWVLPVRARLVPDLAGWILARLKAANGR
jgi:tetraacyldisaccharide 4'-kinase